MNEDTYSGIKKLLQEYLDPNLVIEIMVQIEKFVDHPDKARAYKYQTEKLTDSNAEILS